MAGEDIDEADETRRLVEASAWRVALFEADLEATEDFEAWLASDGRNAAAWHQVSAGWDRFGQEAMEPELIIARRDALERARRHKQRRFAGAGGWRFGGRATIAATFLAMVVLGGTAGFGVWRSTRPDVYQTAFGERRSITLADGSHIALDSNSLLKVRLLQKARLLELVRGQAHFEVAHDVARPFTVHARDKTVVATGTSFNVDLFGPNVIVTLIEGRVSVLQDRAARLPIVAPATAPLVVARLAPGEQFVGPLPVAEGSRSTPPPVVLKRVSIDRTTAWETGQLVFENEALSSVAQRVARYTDQPIVVDPDVATLQLSGVFNAGDLPAFVGAVQRVLPVTAATEDDGAVHLRRRRA